MASKFAPVTRRGPAGATEIGRRIISPGRLQSFSRPGTSTRPVVTGRPVAVPAAVGPAVGGREAVATAKGIGRPEVGPPALSFSWADAITRAVADGGTVTGDRIMTSSRTEPFRTVPFRAVGRWRAVPLGATKTIRRPVARRGSVAVGRPTAGSRALAIMRPAAGTSTVAARQAIAGIVAVRRPVAGTMTIAVRQAVAGTSAVARHRPVAEARTVARAGTSAVTRAGTVAGARAVTRAGARAVTLAVAITLGRPVAGASAVAGTSAVSRASAVAGAVLGWWGEAVAGRVVAGRAIVRLDGRSGIRALAVAGKDRRSGIRTLAVAGLDHRSDVGRRAVAIGRTVAVAWSTPLAPHIAAMRRGAVPDVTVTREVAIRRRVTVSRTITARRTVTVGRTVPRPLAVACGATVATAWPVAPVLAVSLRLDVARCGWFGRVPGLLARRRVPVARARPVRVGRAAI